MAKKFTRNTETVWSRDETESQKAFRGLFCYASSILPPFNLGSMQHNQRPPSLIGEDLLWSLLLWKPEVSPRDRKFVLRRVACFPDCSPWGVWDKCQFLYETRQKKKETNKRKVFEVYRRWGNSLNCHNLSLLGATSEKVSVLELEKRKRLL